MSIDKSWSAVILSAFLLAGSFCPAQPSPQESPPGIPFPEDEEEERLRVLQRLREQLNQDRQLMREQEALEEPPPEGPFMQQPPAKQPPAAPAQAPAPAPSVQAQSSLQAANGKLRLIYKDADLIAFIRQISELLGLTPLIIDSEVQGTVTLDSSELMTKEEVRALFTLILKTKNVSLIENNGIYQVVPVSSAMRSGIELIEHPAPVAEPEIEPVIGPEAESPEIPRISTNVVRVEFMPVRDLIEPLKLLMTEGGVIMPYERLNMLILTDYSDNIERILEIVRLLDNRYMDPELIELVRIEHNASADIAADLQKMFGSGKQDSSTGISFISLDRMNAIFLIAASKRGLEEVKRWIDVLDTTTGRNIQNNVYIVKNSTASNIATLLSALYGGEGTTAADAQPSLSGSASGLGGGTTGSAIGQGTGQRGSFGSFTNSRSQQSGNYEEGGFGGLMGGGIFGGGQQLNPQFSASRGISSVIIQGGEFSGLQDTIRLVVDDINNRLFIQSTAADYAFILEAIESMDVMPRQVRIDASIYEVDLTDDLSFGVGAALRERTSGSTTEFYLNSSTEGAPAGFTAINVALIGNSQELISAINALREKTNVKVLENPTVFAMDGKEAYITVGAEVPYPGTSYTQAVGGTTTSVQYRDTGVTLFVRPRISESGSITMDVLQEVSGVGVSTSLGPTFTKSRVETTLIVKDGETVAIAGLIRDSDGLTRTGFPLISDIPILGSLFGQTSKTKRRSELVILITPHVIGNADKFKEITNGFKDSMRNVRRFADKTEQERIRDKQDAIDERIEAEEKRRREEERQRRRENR
ncbi:MAG: type II secretion system secretin GspD [Acidobacteria bacterium]|nr:type II secretion system secretin GspD [Acidobacteriota bacterium]